MVMDTIQIRLNPFWLKRIDQLVKEGIYSSRSEAVRDAVRRVIIPSIDWAKEVGTIKWDGKDSVKEIRKIRRKLSKQPIDLDEINSL